MKVVTRRAPKHTWELVRQVNSTSTLGDYKKDRDVLHAEVSELYENY